MTDKAALRVLLVKSIDAVIDRYFDQLPLDVLAQYSVKTEAHYLRVLERAVRDLYYGNTTADDFLGTMTVLLDEQIVRAWNEGMRNNDLDPAKDMTPEWEQMIKDIQDEELSHLQDFIDAIEQARDDKTPIDPLLSRAELWASRYTDVVNQAELATAEPDDKFEWVFGDTDHCNTCERLNGLVARAEQWEEAGFRPQSPPNEMLDCGGWRCQCELVPTDKRRTADVLSILLDIAASRGI